MQLALCSFQFLLKSMNFKGQLVDDLKWSNLVRTKLSKELLAKHYECIKGFDKGKRGCVLHLPFLKTLNQVLLCFVPSH